MAALLVRKLEPELPVETCDPAGHALRQSSRLVAREGEGGQLIGKPSRFLQELAHQSRGFDALGQRPPDFTQGLPGSQLLGGVDPERGAGRAAPRIGPRSPRDVRARR